MKPLWAVIVMLSAPLAWAQVSGGTRVQGNTQINATSENVTTIATGSGTSAKTRIGVVQGDKKGDMRINVNAANVTTVVGGRNKKACTNIGGVVSDECK